MAVPISYYFLYFEQLGVLYIFYWLSYTKHMIINKVTMNIVINLIQMLLIFVFEIRPGDRLQNDSDAMTVFIIISLFPRDQWSELFNVAGVPTAKWELLLNGDRMLSWLSAIGKYNIPCGAIMNVVMIRLFI